MESMLGKIILEKNKPNPVVIISEESKYLRGLQLVKSCDKDSKIKVSKEDFIKIKYSGKKLEDVVADCGECVTIFNLNIREIGVFTEEGYIKLLRNYSNYHCGDRRDSYQIVRSEVQKQLIKGLKF